MDRNFEAPQSDRSTYDTQVLNLGSVPTGGPSYSVVNTAGGSPDAAYWQRRFRRERIKARLFLAGAIVATLGALGLGVIAWGLAVSSTVVSDLSGIASSLLPPSDGLPGGATGPDSPNGPGTSGLDGLGGLTNPDGSLNSKALSDLLSKALGSTGQNSADINKAIDDALESGLLPPDAAKQLQDLLNGGLR